MFLRFRLRGRRFRFGMVPVAAATPDSFSRFASDFDRRTFRLVRMMPTAAQHRMQGYGHRNEYRNDGSHVKSQSSPLLQHPHYRRDRQVGSRIPA